MTIKIGAIAMVVVSALSSGCAAIGGGQLSLGLQRTDALYQKSNTSSQVVPTLQWKMALNGPTKPFGSEYGLNASESGETSEDTFLWTVIGVAAGYYLVQELYKEEKQCNPPITVLPLGFSGTVTTTTRC
jgi:hypothetical protein